MTKLKYYLIIGTLLFLNLLTVYVLNRSKKKNIVLSKDNILKVDSNLSLRKNLLLNYQYDFKKLDTTQIIYSSIVEPFGDTIKDCKIILFYSEDICDVCESDLFYFLKKRKSILDNLISLVPITSFSEFCAYNSQYELNIPVLAYEGSFQSLPGSNGRGMFIAMDPNFNIRNILLPQKPLHKDLLDDFFKLHNISPSY